MTDEEKKALERIEDFLTTNIIVSISNDETANSENLKAFISKNEYLSIEFIASMFLKQSKEIEELKEDSCCMTNCVKRDKEKIFLEDKIKAKIEEIENEDKKYKNYLKDGRENFTPEYVWARPVLQSLLEKE